MSLFDYKSSQEISKLGPPFYALIMAAMRQADTINSMLLKQAWPEVHTEMTRRYNAPGGALNDDEKEQLATAYE